jgi:hypothetical protein
MRLLALALLLAACAGTESDIERAKIGYFFTNVVKGKDRGLYAYWKMIEDHSTKPQGGRYQYIAPAHLSNFYIERATRGIGGTKIVNSDYLAGATDKIFIVMAFDPTGAMRSLACEQLGRLILPLPPGSAPLPMDNMADVRINQVADDLARMEVDAREGKKVPVSAVVERMRALAQERPRSTLGAHQIVRVLAAKPIVGAAPGPIRSTAEEIGPPIVRDAVIVVLRNAAVGISDEDPDDSALVRRCAIDVLTRIGSDAAREGAIRRLGTGIDPPESDPDTRCALLLYLGSVGGPGAFEACLGRFDDLDIGVRYTAQTALQQITGARVPPDAAAWHAYAQTAPAKANG